MSDGNPMRERLENMLAAGTDNALLRFSLGQACLDGGEAETAVTHLREAVDKDPNYSAAWKLLGRALAEAGAHVDAIGAYQQGITVARERGDLQAAKEMEVFLKRARRASGKTG